MNKTNTRRAGFYWNGDKPYLSVTTVLQAIDKPALRYWFGKEVYYAMVKDPSLSEKAALSAPYQTSGKAKDRGSSIHSIVEAYKSTGDPIDTIPSPLREYAVAFYDFMRDHKATMLEQEKTVFSDEHRLAGTLDIYAEIEGRKFIIDVKTGKDIYPEVGLQLSAYREMLGKPVDEIAVLLLETGQDGYPTTKYKFQTLKPDFETFLAAKRVWEWLNQDKCVKIGYKGGL